MLNSFPYSVIVGSILGFLSGLGVGGGSLLMLWLTLVLGTEYAVARSINLLFFIPSSVICCLFRWKQGAIKIRQILPAVISGSISAVIFSMLGQNLDLEILKKIFGLILLAAGLREVTYRPKKDQRLRKAR